MTTFTDQERAVWSPPDLIPSAVWGERNRELSVLTSASAGRWSLAMIPFMRPVLDALDDQDIDTVVLLKSTQIAGTETFLTWLGRVADQDPGPAMMCFSDEDTALEIVEDRLRPMFRSSPPLAAHIEEARFNKAGIKLRNNFSLIPAWASSIGKTASRSIRYLYLSEITKPGYGKVGEEGSVITRIIQRTETFPNKKIAIETTPTIVGDNIDKQLQLCDAIYDWHVPCPACGAFQVLRFKPGQKYRNIAGAEALSGGVVFDDGDDRRARAATARYECGECKARWTTAEKNAAVARGVSSPRTEVIGRPQRVGFHISRLYSLFPGGRLESLVLSFLQAKNDPRELQSFTNNSLAEHWKKTRIIVKDDELLAAQCDLPRGRLPDSAHALIATIDMQQTGFWFVVRAWNVHTRTSWMVECGTLETWDHVDDLIFERTWKKSDGREMGIWRTMIDIGGTKELGKKFSRTEEVQLWWIANRYRCFRRVFLCKGSSRAMETNVVVGKPIETTASGKKIEQFGLRIARLDTDELKREAIEAIRRAADGSSRAAYLHAATPAAYFRHITAEEERDDGTWERVRPDNHWLDCEMMQQGAASRELHGGIDFLARRLPKEDDPAPGTDESPPDPVEKPPEQAQEPPKPPEKPPEIAPKQAQIQAKKPLNPPQKPAARRVNQWARRPGGL